MIQKNKLGETLYAFLPTFLTMVALTGAMVGVFALLERLTEKVWLGAALGIVAALVNFFVLILSSFRAEEAETPEKGALYMRSTYLVRSIVLIAAVVIALKTERFDPVATLLPLCFVRLALFVPQLKPKKNEEVEP